MHRLEPRRFVDALAGFLAVAFEEERRVLANAGIVERELLLVAWRRFRRSASHPFSAQCGRFRCPPAPLA